MVGEIFSELQTIVASFGTLFQNAINSVVGMIYDSTEAKLTVFGGLILIATGVGLFSFLFKWVTNLIRVKM